MATDTTLKPPFYWAIVHRETGELYTTFRTPTSPSLFSRFPQAKGVHTSIYRSRYNRFRDENNQPLPPIAPEDRAWELKKIKIMVVEGDEDGNVEAG